METIAPEPTSIFAGVIFHLYSLPVRDVKKRELQTREESVSHACVRTIISLTCSLYTFAYEIPSSHNLSGCCRSRHTQAAFPGRDKAKIHRVLDYAGIAEPIWAHVVVLLWG